MSEPLNILQIAPRIPWPPSDGGAIGIYNITRFVAARGHRITFVAFERGGAEENVKGTSPRVARTAKRDERIEGAVGANHLPNDTERSKQVNADGTDTLSSSTSVRPINSASANPALGGPVEDTSSVRPVDRAGADPALGGPSNDMATFCRVEIVEHDTRNSVFGAVRNLFSREPYSISKYRCAAMYARLDALCAEQAFDVVHVDHAHMAMYGEYVQRRYGIPYVLREHNFEATIHRRFAEQSRLPVLAQYLRMQAARLYRYEMAALEFPDVIAAITMEDVRTMGRAAHHPAIRIIPAGVDVDRLQPFSEAASEAHVVMAGPLHWAPNLDAALWFAQEIWPRIRAAVPEARCTIAGAEAPQKLLRMTGGGISVPGFVDDFAALLASARVLAVPLRVGGGMRVKLLEYFACGKAVVSTSIGAEGNLARNENEILLADDAADFAAAVVRVLKNPDLAMSLGRNARQLAEKEYAWTNVAAQFEDTYRQAMKKKPQRKNHEDTKKKPQKHENTKKSTKGL